MNRTNSPNRSTRLFLMSLFSLALLHSPSSKGADPKPAQKPTIEEQLEDLRAAVSRVEASLAKEHEDAADFSSAHTSDAPQKGDSNDPKMSGMGMKKGMGAMRGGGMKAQGGMMGMGGMMKGMGSMSAGSESPSSGGMQMGMGSMGMMKKGGMMKGMGMMMMGKTPDSSMEVSALPGFPGASHIYHIGASEFFLDHREHLGLTPDQQKKLNELKSNTLLKQNEFERQLERAEEQLWSLTSEAEPDAKQIESALAEIGVLTTEKRLDFIRSVGAAAEVLTTSQRALLRGESTGGEPAAGSSHDNHEHDDQPTQ